MKIRFLYRNIEQSQAIENRAHEELKLLDKIIAQDAAPSSVDLVLAKEGHSQHLHQVEIHASFPLGDFDIEEHDADLHTAVTRAVAKLIHQVRQAKDRSIDQRNRPDEHKNPLRSDKDDFKR